MTDLCPSTLRLILILAMSLTSLASPARSQFIQLSRDQQIATSLVRLGKKDLESCFPRICLVVYLILWTPHHL